jgi:hypothetical protein
VRVLANFPAHKKNFFLQFFGHLDIFPTVAQKSFDRPSGHFLLLEAVHLSLER